MRFSTLKTAAVAQLATTVLAHPHAAAQPEGSALYKRAVNIDAYKNKLPAAAPKYVTNEVIVEKEKKGPTRRAAASNDDIASALVKTSHPNAQFRLVTSYSSRNGVTHYAFKQTANGIDIDTADFNVNVKGGKVFSYGDSFYKGAIPALRKRDNVDAVSALKGASATLSLGIDASAAKAEAQKEAETFKITGVTGTLSEPVGKLVYFADGSGGLKLAWRVETDIDDNWLLTYVDASTPSSIIGLVDYGQDAEYTVFPWEVPDPSRGGRKLEVDPWDLQASPATWHGPTFTNTTRGNNGNAQANYANDAQIETDYRPYEADLKFNYDLDLSANYTTYANSSTTQLFYTANMFHDLMWHLGFNEESGNFQADNFGRGGLGGDPVTLNTQDGAGLNNANFFTPIDGQVPRMRMYVWNYTTPFKDSSFDAGVVIHEYGHGVSNRLTGGALNGGCLATTEAGGMGEGWSDFYAITIGLETTDTRATDYTMGPWIRSRPSGIRTYPYSTSLSLNPMTYEFAEGSPLVHYIGSIWNSMLYEVVWNLIDKHGMNGNRLPTFDSKGVPTDGRFLALQLVTDGLKLQPCRPNMLDARDGILDADKALTGGANQCEIWKGFAKRGLGVDATRPANPTLLSGRKNGFNIPSGVCGCNADNCLRALRATSPATRLNESRAFCETFTQTVITDVTVVKPYLTSACGANVISRVSSACGCIPSDN